MWHTSLCICEDIWKEQTMPWFRVKKKKKKGHEVWPSLSWSLATWDVNSPEKISLLHGVATNMPCPHDDGMTPLKPQAKRLTLLLELHLSGVGIQQPQKLLIEWFCWIEKIICFQSKGKVAFQSTDQKVGIETLPVLVWRLSGLSKTPPFPGWSVHFWFDKKDVAIIVSVQRFQTLKI